MNDIDKAFREHIYIFAPYFNHCISWMDAASEDLSSSDYDILLRSVYQHIAFLIELNSINLNNLKEISNE